MGNQMIARDNICKKKQRYEDQDVRVIKQKATLSRAPTQWSWWASPGEALARHTTGQWDRKGVPHC